MKIRNGFVSNSSSSSFVCSICKESAVDYDGGCEVEYLTCENGHQICTKHLKGLKKKTVKEMREALLKDVDTWDHVTSDVREAEKDSIRGFTAEEVEDSYNDLTCGEELTEETCPLCSFKTLTDGDLLDYLLMQMGKTKKEMIDEVVNEYSSLDEFEKAVKAHKKAMKEQGKK